MTFKALLFILFLIVSEIIHLVKEGVAEHKYAFGILKILILNTIFLFVLSIKYFSFGILGKIKEAIPPLIKTATKVILTPIKTPKKNKYRNL